MKPVVLVAVFVAVGLAGVASGRTARAAGDGRTSSRSNGDLIGGIGGTMGDMMALTSELLSALVDALTDLISRLLGGNSPCTMAEQGIACQQIPNGNVLENLLLQLLGSDSGMDRQGFLEYLLQRVVGLLRSVLGGAVGAST